MGGKAEALTGGVMSGIGARESAKALNKAGQVSFGQYRNETGASRVMQMLEALGERGFGELAALPRDEYTALFGRDQSYIDQSTKRMAEIDARLKEIQGRPGGTKAEKDAANAEKKRLQDEYKVLGAEIRAGPSRGYMDMAALRQQFAGKNGWLGDIESANADTKAAGDKLVADYNADTGTLSMRDAATLSDFDRATRSLGQQGRQNLARTERQASDLLGDARKWGAGREALIQRDYERGLKGANDSATSDMIASGLGASTLRQNAMAQNARSFGDVRANAMQNLADQQLNATMQARNQGNAAINATAGGNLSLNASRASGRTGLQTQQTGALAQRMGGATTLAGQNIERNASLAQQPALMRANLFGSAAFNPFLGQDTTKYNPGASPTGALLTSLGNSISGIAPYAAANGRAAMGGGKKGG